MSKFNQVKQRILIIFATFFCLTFTSQLHASLNAELSDGEKLSLIGIGKHKELRNDIYLGALFGPASVSDADMLIGDNVAKRMSIRLISKYSARKMARHWKERLAMNNSRSQWQPLTKEIVLFSRIFKRNFQEGDEINIDHVPGVGTQVSLNGTLFKTINKAGFADLLLNVWLGTNPPTKAFKFAIRGEDKTTLASYSDSFSNMQIIDGRFDADLIDVTKVAAVESAVTKPTAKKVTPKADKVAKTTNLPNKKKNVEPPKKKPVAKVVNTTVDKSKDNIPTKAKVDSEKVATLDIKMDKPKLPEIKLESSLIGSHQIVNQSETNTEALPEIEEDFFDADLISGSYTRDLINAIKQFEKYPKKALIRGEEGTVEAKVTIGVNGEVINVEIVERSGSRILDRAVIKMVNKAAPFEVIPKELKLETFEFDLPITFQL
jgi:protein TonB